MSQAPKNHKDIFHMHKMVMHRHRHQTTMHMHRVMHCHRRHHKLIKSMNLDHLAKLGPSCHANTARKKAYD